MSRVRGKSNRKFVTQFVAHLDTAFQLA